MNINSIEELNEAVKENTSPLKAIRLKCLDCSVYSVAEVRECFAKSCPLYPFRMGKNPFRKKREMSDEEKSKIAERLKATRHTQP